MKASKLIVTLLKLILKHGNLQMEDYNGFVINEVNHQPDQYSDEGTFILKSEVD